MGASIVLDPLSNSKEIGKVKVWEKYEDNGQLKVGGVIFCWGRRVTESKYVQLKNEW